MPACASKTDPGELRRRRRGRSAPSTPSPTTISRETLARALDRPVRRYEHAWHGDIDGRELALSLERVEA